MTFQAAPEAIIETGVLTDPKVTAWLADIAADAEANVARLAPNWITQYPGWEIKGGTRTRRSRPVAYVEARSPFWHIPEFGTVRVPMTPYLRPGALAALNQRGGRLKETPK